jgi:hypothetical protein
VGVIDKSYDDSVDGFAVGGESAGKVIHLKSDGIGIVNRASEAPPNMAFLESSSQTSK